MAKTMFYIILGITASVILAVMVCKLLGIGEGSSTQEDKQLNFDIGFERHLAPRRRDTGAQRLMPHRES